MDRDAAGDGYRRAVEEAVLDGGRFVRAVFSGRRRGRTVPWQRVVLRPVELKGRPHVQFTYFDERKSFDRNRAGGAVRAELAGALDLPFRSFFVELTDRELHVTFSKRDEVAVRTVRKPAPVTRDLTHDRQKAQPLPAGVPDAYLVSAGVMAPDGKVKADRYDKFRQVNEFLKLLEQMVTRPGGGALPETAVDFGCGNAYLTFAAYHYFRDRLGHPLAMTGVDVQGDLLEGHRVRVAQLGWEGFAFADGSIAGYEPARAPDLVLALHACDTATDDALARAIGWGSRFVMAVPCCHHELQRELRARPDETALKPVYRYGILAERLADVLTDTLRALTLRICGYRCDVVQFVASEHTARNVLLRATRAGRTGDPAVVAEYVRLRDFLGVTPYLERALGERFRALLEGARPDPAPDAPDPADRDPEDAPEPAGLPCSATAPLGYPA